MIRRPRLYRSLFEGRRGAAPKTLSQETASAMNAEFRHGGLDGVQAFVVATEIAETIRFVLDQHGIEAQVPTPTGKAGKVSVDLFWGMLGGDPVGSLLVSWTHKALNHWVAKVRVT